MHVATGHSIGTIASEISTYNALAKEASRALQDEYEALQQLYEKILDRYQAQKLDSDEWREYGAVDDAKGELWDQEEEIQETVTLVPRDVDAIHSNGEVKENNYIQVVVDCTSLKFILDPSKKGYASGTQLVDDLSNVIDRFLHPLPFDSDESRDATPEESHTPRPGESFPHHGSLPVTTSAPIPASEASTSTARKRFTFLIDLERHIDKNYPLRKEKARTFVAGLHDAPGVEVVCVGLGRKSVEAHMSEIILHQLDISQCANLFIAVGITSNTSHHVLNLSRPTLATLARHPGAHKLAILRSGGPFDRAFGFPSVAIDKYLSVQVQVPAYKPAREEEEKRERRSFAPSPVAPSKRLVHEERIEETGWTPVVASLSGLSLGSSSSAREGEKAKDEQEPRQMSLSRSEHFAPEVLTIFDPLAIQKAYGKPLCAKYHLNGTCRCSDHHASLHAEITLSPAASKQLAVWAADQACPEGLGCPDAAERKCCFWFHEPQPEGVVPSGERAEADEWIAVDKKGKPIVQKMAQAPRVWQPSASCKSSGKLVRHDFHPLISTIRQFERERNEYKHERGLIGTELKRAYGQDLYSRLALSGFREYTGLAEKAGLVKLGYFSGTSGWISLA